MTDTTADRLHFQTSGEAASGHDAHKPAFFARWFMSTNHKDIGTLYLIFAIVAGIVGGTLSGLMRWELAEPGIQHLEAWSGATSFDEALHFWNVMVTAHGLIMIFFTLMPATMGGFGNWFVPILIGAPDMAFPRMNNISFWLLVPAFICFSAPPSCRAGPAMGRAPAGRSTRRSRRADSRGRRSTW